MDPTQSSQPAAAGSATPDLQTPVAPARGRRRFVALGVIALVVGASVGLYLLVTADQEDTDDAQVAADIVPLAAQVTARVKETTVADNQPVKQGDLLLTLDDAEYAAKVTLSEAELKTKQEQAAAADAQVAVVEAASRGGLVVAQAQLAGTATSEKGADAQVAQAEAGLALANALAQKAALDLKRARSLSQQKVIATTALDSAITADAAADATLQQARAQLLAAKEARRLAKSRVGEARGRLGQSTPVDAQIAAVRASAKVAHAMVQAAEATLKLARITLSYTRVVAPAAGVVSRLSVHAGQLVQPGQALMTLVPEQTYVVANFKETQIARMRPGQSAKLVLDAFPSRTFAGRVESLAGATGASFSLLPPDNSTGNFVKVVQRIPVRIAWVDLRADIRPRAGISVDVTVKVR